MLSASKRIQAFIKKEKRLPNYVIMEDLDKKKEVQLRPSEYNGLFKATNIFRLKNNRLPNYVTLNTTEKTPLAMDYQDNAYTCAPTSLSMAIQLLYGFKSEKECKKACKTKEYKGGGTSPENLIKGAKSLGYKVEPIQRKYTNVAASLTTSKPVIAHIQTKPAHCLGYKNDYGHYLLIYGTKSANTYLLADPTKGLKTCSSTVLDKATNGRNIHYYSVGVI